MMLDYKVTTRCTVIWIKNDILWTIIGEPHLFILIHRKLRFES